jgi:hypothetical protein
LGSCKVLPAPTSRLSRSRPRPEPHSAPESAITQNSEVILGASLPVRQAALGSSRSDPWRLLLRDLVGIPFELRLRSMIEQGAGSDGWQQ